MALTKVNNRMIDGAAVNVLDYGADPTGSESSASAINSAISGGSKAVYIPAGTYLIDGDITLASNLKVFGHGPATVLSMSGSSRRCFKGTTIENVIISDLLIDGNKPTVGWETAGNFDFGIRLGEGATSQSVKNISIQNITIKDVGLDGIYATDYSNIRVSNCNFQNCRRWGVVPQAGIYGGTDFIIEDCYFDQDYGGGPVGKEYPLGAIDSEPGGANAADRIIFRNITGKRNTAQLFAAASSITNSSMNGVVVHQGNLTVNNNITSLNDCSVVGADGYLISDSNSDSKPTGIGNINVFFSTPRSQVEIAGRKNMLPHDFGYEGFWNQPLSAGGSGTSAGLVARDVDGHKVYLRDHQIGPASGFYVANRHSIQANVATGDQVVIFLEVERTDSNTATGNFFSVTLGSGFARGGLQVEQGVTRLLFAYKATANETNPLFTAGLTGTANVQVNVLFRKLKVFINPKQITDQDFTANASHLQTALTDGIDPPATLSGYAQIYVDTADGDLKVRFGDGTVKTIVVDT